MHENRVVKHGHGMAGTLHRDYMLAMFRWPQNNANGESYNYREKQKDKLEGKYCINFSKYKKNNFLREVSSRLDSDK